MAGTTDNQGYSSSRPWRSVHLRRRRLPRLLGGHAAELVVGMAADTATGGYWLVASDGGVFSFAAPFLGSTGNVHLDAPVAAMAASADDLGYRLIRSDGGNFTFGAAPFLGSTGATHPAKSVLGMDSGR